MVARLPAKTFQRACVPEREYAVRTPGAADRRGRWLQFQ